MTKESAFKQIELMHEQKLITENSIIGWYYLYSHKLPKMKPERSLADVLRTIALWMELTDKGGLPGFPYDYQTDIKIPIGAIKNKRPNFIIEVSWILAIVGLLLLFFDLIFGLSSIFLGILLLIVNYNLAGGSKNIDSAIGLRSGRRVAEWIQIHSK